MPWISPLPLKLVACTSPNDWDRLADDETLLPIAPHPGAYGDVRPRHCHEGIDIYGPPDTPVLAVEDGTVVAVTPFGGAATREGYWHDMEAVLVVGASGLIVYGEIAPLKGLLPATVIKAGTQIGNLYPKDYKYNNANRHKDEGKHTFFIHLELHDAKVRKPVKWLVGQPQPSTMRDPTPFLLEAAVRRINGITKAD